MSYANGTTHYNLPQTVGTDKRDWFDSNAAFAAVDAALYSAATGQASDAEAITALQQTVAGQATDIAALQTASSSQAASISTLQTTVNAQAAQIADVRADALDMIEAKDEGTAQVATVPVNAGEYFRYNDVLYIATQNIAVDDTIVPNTNCRATNVGTELTQINSELTRTQTLISEQDNPLLKNYVRALKYGQVVDISINGLQGLVGQTGNTILTLPEELRPLNAKRFIYAVSSYQYEFTIQLNGEIVVFPVQASPAYQDSVKLELTYII